MTHEWKEGDRVRLEGVISEVDGDEDCWIQFEDGIVSIFDNADMKHAKLIQPAAPEPPKPPCQTEADVEIRMQDILIQTYCTKKGGAWAPILENGIEIKHLPTGISVRCDTERSAHANKASAMKRLHFLIAILAAQENIPEPKRTTTQIVELVNFDFGSRIMMKSDGAFYVNVASRAKISYTDGEGWRIEEVEDEG